MRVLLIGVAAVSLLMFVLVRPTLVANKFVGAIDEGNYSLAISLLDGGDETSFASHYSGALCTVELLSPTWRDFLHFRRRIDTSAFVSMKQRNREGKESLRSIYGQESTFEAGIVNVRMTGRKGAGFW